MPVFRRKLLLSLVFATGASTLPAQQLPHVSTAYRLSDHRALDSSASRSVTLSRFAVRIECAGRTARIISGIGVGILGGGIIGYLHGRADHPGLPHLGIDVPSEWEYTPLFALAGGIVGGVVGARSTRCGRG